jgi:hypothetical protein
MNRPKDNVMKLKNQLRNLLLRWRSGELDERAVHEEAEALWTEREWKEHSQDDPRAIILELLEQLSILNWQWITTQDVDILLEFLDTPLGQESHAWKKWHEYWDTLDWTKRRESLANNPYYSKTGPHMKDAED